MPAFSCSICSRNVVFTMYCGSPKASGSASGSCGSFAMIQSRSRSKAAGAGIAAHLHQHVVPRWQGDSNFMPVVARTRALPQLLEDARALLARRWADGA